MNRIYLFLILIFPFSFCFGQTLNVNEIISLKKQDLASVEEYLTAKGWKYISGEETTNEKFGSADFAYGQNINTAAFSYMYSNNTERKRVSYIIFNSEKYKTIVNQIKALGCKLTKSEVLKGSLVKVYQGKTLTFEIAVSKVEDADYTSYSFFVLDNDDYNESFHDRFKE